MAGYLYSLVWNSVRRIRTSFRISRLQIPVMTRHSITRGLCSSNASDVKCTEHYCILPIGQSHDRIVPDDRAVLWKLHPKDFNAGVNFERQKRVARRYWRPAEASLNLAIHKIPQVAAALKPESLVPAARRHPSASLDRAETFRSLENTI
jgi:hypothetical protein